MRWGVYGAAPAQVTDAKDTRRPGSLFVYQFIECSDTVCTSEILIESPNAFTNDDDPPAPRIINLVAIGGLSRRHRHT